MSTNCLKDDTLDQRIEYLDVFRGLGIILMVMGHVAFGKLFDFFIHAFHMPMFFWLSGFLYNPLKSASFWTYTYRKIQTLIIPYLSFGIVHYLLYVVGGVLQHNPIDIEPLIHLFSVNTEGLAICEALWFLTALFFTHMLVFFIEKNVKQVGLKVIFVSAISLFGNYAKDFVPFTLPFALSAACVGTGLFYIGYLFRQKMKRPLILAMMGLSWKQIILGATVSAAMIFVNKYVNMRTGYYAIVPLFWINAVFATVICYNFARLVYPIIKDNCIGKWLTQVGRDSIVYVCTNQIIILATKFSLKGMGFSIIINQIVVLIVSLIALYFFDRLFMNTRLRFFLGK